MGNRGVGIGEGLKIGNKLLGLVALLDETLGLSDVM